MISEVPVTTLIALPTEVLLAKFGAGGHKPGSGSAAALVGMLAGKLVLTVSSLTKQRAGYAFVRQRVEYIERQVIEKLEPSLTDAFQRDAETFDRVIRARRERDSTMDRLMRRHLDAEARELLKPATETPIGICKDCLKVAELGLNLFDIGFKSARGDSGTAISIALAGAVSSLCIAYLNLASLRSEWAKEKRIECNQLLLEYQRIQVDLFSRVALLQRVADDNSQMQLPLHSERMAS